MKNRRRTQLPRAAAARVGAQPVKWAGDPAAASVAEPPLCACVRLLPLLSRPERGHVSGSREVLLQLQEGLPHRRAEPVLQAPHQRPRPAEQRRAGKNRKIRPLRRYRPESR